MSQMIERVQKLDKDAKEMIDFLFDLVDDIKAGKEIAAISAENLPALMTAVEGYQKGIDAAKGHNRAQVVGYTTERSMETFLPYEEESSEPAGEQPVSGEQPE